VNGVLPQNAERTATFLVERTRLAHGRLWDQGARADRLSPGISGESLALIACRRLRGVSEPVVSALMGWSRGERPALLLDSIPTSLDVLRLQSVGRRCVSLLEDAEALAHGDPRHPDGLAFVLHDLCHLEKFVDPAHRVGQVGFFDTVFRATQTAEWSALESPFDAEWEADRDYVFSDMNGSAIFLFAALKMKVRMAVRRQVARQRGSDPRVGGALDPTEQATFDEAEQRLLALLGLDGALLEAGVKVSARRDDPESAVRLLQTFEARGQAILQLEPHRFAMP
jgi:hypothetical protein